MNKHPYRPSSFISRSVVVALALIVTLVAVSGCAARTEPPFGPERLIPADGSTSRVNPDVPSADRDLIMRSAQALSCQHPLGCSCTLDGFQASCAFVFSCIDAGFCECVSGCENIGD